MSTYFQEDMESLDDWISQAEAARIRGVTRQAIAKLVNQNRLRTLLIGGHTLVYRQDVEDFKRKQSGSSADRKHSD